MKIKLKVKPPTEAENKAGQERLRKAIQRGIEAANANQPITRAKQDDGTARFQLHVYVPDDMGAHITQLAQIEQRSISSICQELLGVALGLVMTPAEAAADEASLAIVQRGHAPGATSADIAAATLEGIKRSTGQPSDNDFPPMPTQDDINMGKYNAFTQTWDPKWDWKNNKWRR